MNDDSDLLSGLWRAESAPHLAPRQWESLLAQARAARLSARLCRLFEERGWIGEVPDAPRRHLRSAMRTAEALHRDACYEIARLREALRDVPTPVVLLKGGAYLAAGLPPARGRLFSDVDVMVSRDALPAVETALFGAGWIPEKLDPYDDRYYREWMHELPPMQHVVRGSLLDIHHTITPPTSRFAVDGAPLIARARPLPGDPRLSVLAPVDMVLHSAVHLMQDGDFSAGLRDLLDVDDLLRHFAADPGFWPELLWRARELGFGPTLHQVLTQIERLFGTRPPASLTAEAAALRRGGIGERLIGHLLVVALRPDHPSCDGPSTGISRWLLYVRSHWMRMPWYQIGPHLIRKAWLRALHRWRTAREARGKAVADAGPPAAGAA